MTADQHKTDGASFYFGVQTAPWWRLPAACVMAGLMTACGAFVCMVLYFQFSVYVSDFAASVILTPPMLLLFLGWGAWLGDRLVQKSPTPMLFMARLALALSAFAALAFLWTMPIKALYPVIGKIGWAFPGGAALAGALAIALAAAPSAMMTGAVLPASAALLERGRPQSSLLSGVWLAGAAVGLALGFGLNLALTGPGLWIPAVFLVMTAIGANNLARMSPLSEPAPQEIRLLDRHGLLLLAAGSCLSIVGWSLIRMMQPLSALPYPAGLTALCCLLLGAAGGCILFRLRNSQGAAGAAAPLGIMGFWLALVWAAGDKIAILSDALGLIKSQGMPYYYAMQTVVSGLAVFVPGIAAGYLACGLQSIGKAAASPVQEGKAAACLAMGAGLGLLIAFGLSYSSVSTLSVFRGVGFAAILFAGVLSVIFLTGNRKPVSFVLILALGLTSLMMFRLPGPSTVWTQHDPLNEIAALQNQDFNSILNNMRTVRRQVKWEAHSPKGATAIKAGDGLELLENGAARVNVRWDASRDVMAGLVPAALHPSPKSALILGLGAGVTPGWLVKERGIQEILVAEQNPYSLEMARLCGPANLNVLENSKVQVQMAEFAPVLRFKKRRYDLIVQKGQAAPLASNPGLYTAEFFQLAARRLAPGGVFNLSISIRGIDPIALQSIYGALGEAFTHVHTFRPQPDVLFLVCSKEAVSFNEDALRARLAAEPYTSAMTAVWGTSGLEGLFSRYLAGPGFSRMLSGMAIWHGITSRDDQPQAYAIMAGAQGRIDPKSVIGMQDAEEREHYRKPFFARGNVDLHRIKRQQVELFVLADSPDLSPDLFSPRLEPMVRACQSFQQENYLSFLSQWNALNIKPESPLEIAMNAHALAIEGHEKALDLCSEMDGQWPDASHIIRAEFYWKTGQKEQALGSLEKAFSGMSTHPWTWPVAVQWGLDLAKELAREDANAAARILAVAAHPFCLMQAEEQRLETRLAAAQVVGFEEALAAVGAFGPNHPWTREYLKQRLIAYRAAKDPRTPRALAEMQAYLSNDLLEFSDALVYD
ncbi:hypothetical protein [Desulfatibacillum aliphaticivorans]|uniref:spermine/spermidine synthase domain-containing protein n=1 Tax=Desulfatibacillum aliphaticivorans TaxID=218208 RepID=UPI00041BF918|nr:hypothetical protein [Desulfatibacillum aliphaticivorans]